MNCPTCGKRTTVKKVYLEKDGYKERRHYCAHCKDEFFTYQSRDKHKPTERTDHRLEQWHTMDRKLEEMERFFDGWAGRALDPVLKSIRELRKLLGTGAQG